MKKILIIQTAFIGDVILATSLVEKLSAKFPDAQIEFLVRKGNGSLLQNNLHIQRILTWDKKNSKLKNFFTVLFSIRKRKYDLIINCHRFASSGILTAFSGAKEKRGYRKNPFSFFFTKKFEHSIGNGKHETERLNNLIEDLTGTIAARPKLYPSEKDFYDVRDFKSAPYVCIAPTSVWFTKQLPFEKWKELILKTTAEKFFLIGGKADYDFCEELKESFPGKKIINLCGRLSFLQSAALMKDALMNYVNDSAPMHFASAMNAPTTAFFCSTVPAFGFGPLSDNSTVAETKEILYCRPCGLHGYNQCPLKHFKCAYGIEMPN